jgi:transcriptional regulator with XRE-family HTH domain
MPRIRLQVEREAQSLSVAKLSRRADLNPATISWAEQRGFRLYDGQLRKLADALGFDGDPRRLLEQVPE